MYRNNHQLANLWISSNIVDMYSDIRIPVLMAGIFLFFSLWFWFCACRILLLQQAGLTDYTQKRIVPNNDYCKVNEQKTDKGPTQLRLDQMGPAFVVLAVWLALSTLAFLGEIVMNRIR